MRAFPATWRGALLLSLSSLLVAACDSPRERGAAALAKAQAAADLGDTERAIALLLEAQSLDPRDLAVVTRLAELLDSSGNTWGALRTLAALPDDVPTDRALLRVKARALIHSKDFAAAARILEASDRSDRSDHSDRADTTLIHEWVEAAALDGSPESLVAFPELARHSPTERTLEILHRALVYSERWEEAAAVEQEFERLFPAATKSTDMLLRMARRRNRADDPEAALVALAAILERNPVDTAALVERALSLTALERAPEARHSLRLVLASEPNNVAALSLLASLSKTSRRRAGDRE